MDSPMSRIRGALHCSSWQSCIVRNFNKCGESISYIIQYDKQSRRISSHVPIYQKEKARVKLGSQSLNEY
ncbi:hypothetical protein BJX66DRAFT_161975 [Aspergillus keveii]|uniref:Uncharacterized protein n=1 Tax=Aspergillus keveii TaxID=714993 RepID=A0ABR4G9K7_9EURO